jgi:hypothetical protein
MEQVPVVLEQLVSWHDDEGNTVFHYLVLDNDVAGFHRLVEFIS